MTQIEYVPILPYPKRPGNIESVFGYDMQTELPYVLEVRTTLLVEKRIDTVWGIEGFAWTSSIIILPCSLFVSEIEARLQIDTVIQLV